jgi:hypothetical protein
VRLEKRPFVVLHHQPGDAEASDAHGRRAHYDLLIDVGEDQLLLTWRLPEWPPRQPLEVERQNDHRRIYLTYEGEVSGGRGHVRRVDTGVCDVALVSNEQWLLTFAAFELRITPASATSLLATPEWKG